MRIPTKSGICINQIFPHINVDLTLHQLTQCRPMTYQQTLAADTSMAENTLERLDLVTSAVVPANLVSGKLISHGVDTIDVMKESSTAGHTG